MEVKEMKRVMSKTTALWCGCLAAAVLTMLAGCAENDSAQTGSSGVARGRLTTTIVPFIGESSDGGSNTRATETTGTEQWLRRTQMSDGDQFLLHFPDGHGAYSPTSDGAGKDYYPTCDGSGGVYIGDGANEVEGSIYLLSGQSEGTMRGYYPASWGWATTFSVQKLQQSSSNYEMSDLMFGTGALVRKPGATEAEGTMDFRHAMAKIKVTVTAGSNVSHLYYVRIVSGYAKGTLKVTDHDKQQLIFAGDGSHEAFDKSKYGEEITQSDPLNLYDAGGTPSAFPAGSSLTVSGLLPPQELAVSDAFLEVKVRVQVDYYHGGAGTAKDVFTRYRFASKQVVEGGHCYTLSVEPAVDEGVAEVTIKGFDANNTATSFGNSISVSAPDTYYLSDKVSMKMVPVLREGYSLGTVTTTDEEEAYTRLRGTTVTGTLGPYYIGQVEVTEAVWDAVMGGSSTSKNPKTGISWNQICGAGGFLDKLNAITEDQRPGGFRFELPTEAQWEYAAKGGIHGDDSYTWSGVKDAASVGNVARYGTTSVAETGTKTPNLLGIYDMSGNVEEILADWYEATPVASRGKDYIHMPAASASGNVMAAGGSYSDGADNVKVTFRRSFAQSATAANRGFRLVLRKVQVGDVYYSNGACGTYWEHPTSTSGTVRTPVGIVFNDETTDYDKVRGFKSGHVMALKEVTDVAGEIIWTKWADDMTVQTASGSQNLNNLFVTDTHYDYVNTNDQFIQVMADLDGLKHCETARANAEKSTTWNIGNLPAINAAFNFTLLPTPVTSSGWYLPSIGQCYHWWVTMGKSFDEYDTFFPADTKASNWSKGNYSFYISSTVARNVAGKMLKAINDFVNEKLGTTQNIAYFTPLSETGEVWDYTYNADGSKHMQNEFRFWTSTENTAHVAWYLRFNINGGDRDIDIWCQPAVHKSTTSKMRPVLSF